MRELKQVEIMEDVCKYVGVSLQEISCCLFDEEQLYIRGSIRTLENYHVRGNLQIRADILNEDGKIIYSIEEFQKRSMEFLYDSFELSRFGAAIFFKEFELGKCTVRVYPIIRKNMRRTLDEERDIC